MGVYRALSLHWKAVILSWQGDTPPPPTPLTPEWASAVSKSGASLLNAQTPHAAPIMHRFDVFLRHAYPFKWLFTISSAFINHGCFNRPIAELAYAWLQVQWGFRRAMVAWLKCPQMIERPMPQSPHSLSQTNGFNLAGWSCSGTTQDPCPN